jgi:hypothetical protein
MFEETKESSARSLILAALANKEMMFSDLFLACQKAVTPDELKRFLLKLELEKKIEEVRTNVYRLRKS